MLYVPPPKRQVRGSNPLGVATPYFAEIALGPLFQPKCSCYVHFMDTDSQPIEARAHPDQIKGRGAVSNRSGRFEATSRAAIEEIWEDEAPPPLKTTLEVNGSRSIISKVPSPDMPFNRSINPYRGCEHGCVYCFARPTHAYLGYSPGLDFETKLVMKPNAAALLRKALSKTGYAPEAIAIGTNTDPYQPVEKQLKIMRGVLEVLSEFNHPVTIVTKGTLIERDLDLLADLARDELASVALSVTTLSSDLKRRLEPRTPSGSRVGQVPQAITGTRLANISLTLPSTPFCSCTSRGRLSSHAATMAGKAG